ncbi:MAG: radical SAM protein [Candidatus Omnitrophica bacterium]|nr:radical SAM protein [Candidatus Omnitrophota bacterium]
MQFFRDRFQNSSVHFQVALQFFRFSPKAVWRSVVSGWKMYRGGKRAGKPVFLHLEPTGACNLQCQMCPRTTSITRDLQAMPFDLFTRIVREVDPLILALVGFGEPLLHPRLLDMVRYAVRRGITVRVSTNATLLTSEKAAGLLDAGLQQIWFSVDSPDPEHFESIRQGASFKDTMGNIKGFMAAVSQRRRPVAATVNCTLTARNVGEAAAMVRFCHDELKVKPTFARSYGYGLEAHSADLLQNTPAVRGALEAALTAAWEVGWKETALNLQTILVDLAAPLDGKGPCYFPYYAAAVSWDGRLSPCCLYYDYQFKAGKIGPADFSSLWNGPEFQRFRQALLADRSAVPVCRNCPLSDVSIHNILHGISRAPLLGRFAGREYNFIDREIKR